jgi:hypothetical protein
MEVQDSLLWIALIAGLLDCWIAGLGARDVRHVRLVRQVRPSNQPSIQIKQYSNRAIYLPNPISKNGLSRDEVWVNTNTNISSVVCSPKVTCLGGWLGLRGLLAELS